MGRNSVQSPVGASDEQTVPLFVCDGRALAPGVFVQTHAHVLSPPERVFLEARLAWLESPPPLPKELGQCLVRTPREAPAEVPALIASRSGERSAFLSNFSIQLKGCHPVPTAPGFPVDHLPFGETAISRSFLPFGVMTAEAVIRELLGHCFMREYGLAQQATPLSVWEYGSDGASKAFCLVLAVSGERRIESYLEDHGGTVGQLIGTGARREPGSRALASGSEVTLRGVNLWGYAESKARLLSEMHFRGGFRGVLNSNIGNDVLIGNPRGRVEIALCDFDTFFMVDVPERPERNFVEAFALQTLVEVIAGSLPILQYVDLPDGCSTESKADAFGAVYFPKSTLWRVYHRRLFASAKARGWDLSLLEEALQKVRRSEACADVLSTRVLSRQALERVASGRAIYFTHN